MSTANLFGQEPWARRGEQPVSSIGMSELPVGVPVPWPAATAPAGWLICDGSAVPAGCPTLSALYGANLPDLRGRVIVGLDAAQAEFDTLGETGGAKTHTLTSAQMPSHGHTQNAHAHGSVGHNHGGTTGDNRGTIYMDHPGNTNTKFFNPGTSGARWTNTRNTSGGSDLDHWHGVPSDASSISNATATNQNTGGGGAHNNLQPYKVFNYIVRAA